jgi:DNA-directed RNA polymerase subunit delta
VYQRKKSEADWAVEILQEKQEPLQYLDLIKEICDKMGKKANLDTITSVYTRLNMDNRLVYEGDGYWYYDTSKINREE